MTQLSLSLLGSFQVTLAGEPVTSFESNKVRALLAYLAVEADRPHRRESLVGLLWPDWPERAARGNLRHDLAQLRRVIGDRQAKPPFLLISRETIQFNRASDHWLDVAAFTALVADLPGSSELPRGEAPGQLAEEVDLYRGKFLEGFSLKDSAAFDDWVLLKREHLQRQALTSLRQLAGHYQQRGEYESACQYTWRQIELEPWQEEAHRQLMLLLALSGQRGAALAQYETCCRLLAEELGVEVGPETTKLYEQIRDGLLSRGAEEQRGKGVVAATPPPFLSSAPLPPSPSAHLVAREGELARLDAFLEQALVGRGQVAFVTGGPGRGKTALIHAFSRRVQETSPDLLVAMGNGNAHTGLGDPYLPFREALGMLTGDVEVRWAAGAISREQAGRLWEFLPVSAQALVELGPELVETFIPGSAMISRAAASGRTDQLAQLEQLVERQAGRAGPANVRQSDLFEQYTRVLQSLAQVQPLLLVLDDLQWADSGSISLLFHLGRHLAGSRILVIGAYRPGDVALGRPSTSSGERERHPLEPVVSEFKQDFGDIEVSLGQARDRQFVEAYLDLEPNRLDAEFREMLYRQTGGHALFTVELVRGMQEREDLVKDQADHWVEGTSLDWKTLPTRVEAVIGERLNRLPAEWQRVLAVASVEGETFTAEVVARVQAVEEQEIIRHLSGELSKEHRLVRAQSLHRLEGQRLSRYRFHHFLFQNYLYYNRLDEVERAHLHEAVGQALEALYGEQTAKIAVQLARHYQAAGLTAKAVDYLHQAGQRAVRLSANQEAIAHFNQGLDLLKTLPDTTERAQQELRLRISLGTPLIATQGYTAPEVEQTYNRARELCRQVGETPELFRVLWGLRIFYSVRAQHRTALELGEHLLRMARKAQDPVLRLVAHWPVGVSLFFLGEFASARTHEEQGIAIYDPQRHHSLAFRYGHDPGVACRVYLAIILWSLGYPDQALERVQEALVLARESSHPYSVGYALLWVTSVDRCRREWPAARKHAEAMIALATEQGFVLIVAMGTFMLGWVLVEQGQEEEGIIQMSQGLAACRVIGSELFVSQCLGYLAEACGKAGRIEEGLSSLAEALALLEETDERYWEAELHRLKGELLLKDEGRMMKDELSAEKCFRKAIEVARQQQAKSLELRAVMSLCCLWQKQGEKEEARQMLAEIYGWFSEGFDTMDLKEAKALLEGLS